MEQELTANQACRDHLLTAEDYTRMCNTDSSLKSKHTTTFALKNGSSESLTVDNSVLKSSAASLVILIFIVIVTLYKRRLRRS